MWHHLQKNFIERYISSLFTLNGCDVITGCKEMFIRLFYFFLFGLINNERVQCTYLYKIKIIHLIMSVPKYAEILSDDEVNYLINLRVDKNFNVIFICKDKKIFNY